jgi:hypothetical protein
VEPRNATDRCYRRRGKHWAYKCRGEPKREQPSNKMTREEAERLRALLRSTKAADLNDALARQRIGRAIAWAIERGPPKLNSRATKKD